MTDSEQWRPVPGHPAHEVSDRGGVRTVDRWIDRADGARRFYRGRVLRAHPHPITGHMLIKLKLGGETTHARVHVLVMRAFVGPCPDGMEVCHNNGVADDNRLENLRYATARENRRDSVLHGTHNMTRKTHCKASHLFDEANTIVTSSGGRNCRSCRSARKRAKRARLRQESAASIPSPAVMSGS